MEIKDKLFEECSNVPTEQTMEWLIQEYGYDVYKLAFFYLKDKGKAEDISQEVFITCYEKLSNFEGEFTKIKHWLLRITSNKCKDVLRSWPYKYIQFTDTLFDRFKNLELSPEERFTSMNEKSELVREILKLPIKYREVIIFYYYEDLKISEISNILQINENTVKTRLRRGKGQLKNTIKGGN
ncbi:sigma-70 family RNA polymerase sigma factor [Bacillus sp. JJ1521]|uniref:sigma-70 family RNA polymerase sigma factor n=1 Tax=Bacillus sp. JJ1521 TaxID=3122957 RepID=UPI002FFF1C82